MQNDPRPRGFFYGGFNMFRENELYTVYAPSDDITFIMRDTFSLVGDLESTAVIGWYNGAPDDELTRKYAGVLTAYFG
jgi:hypothetical protein